MMDGTPAPERNLLVHDSTVCRRPIQCIIPPHMLDTIARAAGDTRGDTRRRSWAVETLVMSQSFRSARQGRADAVQPAWPRVRWRARLRRAIVRRILEAATPDCAPERTISDADNGTRLPGRVVRREGEPPTGEDVVDEAYDGLGATFDLFCEVFGRDSIDGQGMPLDATVHYGRDFANAFWDGRRMVFGDGDGEIFNRFTIAVDVIGHELAHGVTEDEAGLIYWGQSGALNESVSDVFGSLVKQYELGQTVEEADWLIGEGLFTDDVNGRALRSMSEPGTAYDDPRVGTDPQPDHMSGYVNTLEDNAGVHINSGIPNRAFYETATMIGGHAWEQAGQIWYETLRSPFLGRATQFQGFANLTWRTAQRLFGAGSLEADAVREGWAAVGISVSARAIA